MLDAVGNSYSRASYSSSPSPSRSRLTSPTSPIPQSDCSVTPVTPPSQLDALKTNFGTLISKWQQNTITKAEKALISSTHIDYEEYISVTDEFNLGHGVEFINHNLILHEYPSKVHDIISRAIDFWINRTYPRTEILPYGNATIKYEPGKGKQPDASFAHCNLPPPNRQNKLVYMPGTTEHFPTFVFEIAVTNEDRERMLDDANDKFFSVHTSIQVWLGVKLDIATPGAHRFWAAWGMRTLSGNGLRLEQQTEDGAGSTAYLPLHSIVPLAGQFNIPGTLIYHPFPVPPNRPEYFVVNFEELRFELERGVSFMS